MNRVVDLAGVATRFLASDRAHADAIDAVVESVPTHAGESELEIAFGSRACRLPTDPWEHADGDVRAWWRGDDLYLGHGSFSAHVNAASAHIGGDGNLARGFRQLFPYVITHLLAGHDRFVLHGGAIHRDDVAVLVLGGTGSGKSTLVVSALGAQWGVLGDDLVVVRLGPRGPEVTGIAKPVTAPAEVVRSALVDARPLVGDPRGRWTVNTGAVDSAWYPVATTVVSGHGGEAMSELRPLTSQQLLEWLLYSYLARQQPTRRERFLPVAAALTRRRAWELRHSADPSTRVAQVDPLLRQLPGLEVDAS